MRINRGFFSALALAVFIAASLVGANAGAAHQQIFDKSNLGNSGAGFGGARWVRPGAYFSPGGHHKLMIEASRVAETDRALEAGAVQTADYGSFRVLSIDDSSLQSALQGAAEAPISSILQSVRDDMNVLMLRSGAIDTSADDAPGTFLANGARQSVAERAQASKSQPAAGQIELRLVQFVGPVKRQWLDEMRGAGLEPVAYLPSNGYLVRAQSDAEGKVIRLSSAAQSRGEDFVQWEGPFKDEYKIHPKLAAVMNDDPQATVTVAIQIVASSVRSSSGASRDDSSVRAARLLALSVLRDAYRVGQFTNLRLSLPAGSVAKLAALPGVVNIEPWSAPRLLDERSAQILAANLTDDGKAARSPGYLSWLAAHGFNSRFSFAIDVSDTGLDRGSTDPAKLHPDFLDGAGQSRVVYARDYTSDFDAGDIPGHGTLNMSVAAGWNTSTDKAVKDADGFSFGIGVAPFALLGSSKIFQSDGGFGLSQPYTKMVSDAYRDGMRISSNSWGDSANEYTIDAQEYDTRTRDAAPAQSGNQEISVCFAAGNSGPGGFVSSLASAKNVIAVGASESSRKGGEDGCGVDDTDADNVQDMAFFSSGGPLTDGRSKPDICAPGSHIEGAASQNPDFDASGICALDIDEFYFPEGQTLYSWSSGTSHSTPQAAGAAALIRQFFLNRSEDPSAALIKALLLNTATYMNGNGAGGDLPQAQQGWGLIDLDRAFDSVPKVFVNQTTTFTDTGQEFVITGEVKDATQPFRVTLAWSDAPGFSAFVPWVNDLDLEVVINGQVYRGNNFKGQVSQAGGSADVKNNVEAVWLPAGTIGSFVIRVRASNIAGDGVPGNSNFTDQDFALVAYNAERKDAAVAAVSSLALSAGPDSIPDPGETVSMRVILTDLSPIALNGAHAALTAKTAGITVNTGEADYPNIAPGQTAEGAAPFSFSIAGTVACGALLDFSLDVTSASGLSRIPFSIFVGRSQVIESFSDDVENGESKWTHGSGVKKKKKRVDTWSISTKRVRSGGHSWFSDDPSSVTDAHLDTVSIAIPADLKNVQLTFYHTFEFEAFFSLAFDGGVLEISTGGDFEDLGPKILVGGYNGTMRDGTGNPLAGRQGWVGGKIGLFQQVVVDLSSYVGKTVTIRFRSGSDETGKGGGWYIDDVSLRGNRVTCLPASQ